MIVQRKTASNIEAIQYTRETMADIIVLVFLSESYAHVIVDTTSFKIMAYSYNGVDTDKKEIELGSWVIQEEGRIYVISNGMFERNFTKENL